MSNFMTHDTKGVDFHKLVKSLSNSALNYLISIASQESFKRTRKRTFPQFENKELPELKFNSHTVLTIKEIEYYVDSYEIFFETGKLVTAVVHNAYIPNYNINVEMYKWEELVTKNQPIKIVLKQKNDTSIKYDIELHSRSKIFWFHKLLENSYDEPFERKFSYVEKPYNSMSIDV